MPVTSTTSCTWLAVAATVALSACSSSEPAELALAAQPEGDTTELQILVMETACASGQSAEGRINIQDVTVTADEVRLAVSVEPLAGPQDCQGNPWTPVTVQLDQEIAGRRIVDVGADPPQELVVVDPRSGDRTLQESIELVLGWNPPPTYSMVAETRCFCPGTRYRVNVVDGEVVDRRPADGGTATPLEVEPAVAPSLHELIERIRSEPDSVAELVVEDTGELLFVAFDPRPNAIDDEVEFSVEELDLGD